MNYKLSWCTVGIESTFWILYLFGTKLRIKAQKLFFVDMQMHFLQNPIIQEPISFWISSMIREYENIGKLPGGLQYFKKNFKSEFSRF